MIRSINSWYSEAPARWSESQERYRIHLQTALPRFPRKLVTLVRRFTLHDDRLVGLQVVSMGRARDALLTIQQYRDGVSGTAALLVMHFIAVRSFSTELPTASSIAFFDAEAHDDGIFHAELCGRRAKEVERAISGL